MILPASESSRVEDGVELLVNNDGRIPHAHVKVVVMRKVGDLQLVAAHAVGNKPAKVAIVHVM